MFKIALIALMFSTTTLAADWTWVNSDSPDAASAETDCNRQMNEKYQACVETKGTWQAFNRTCLFSRTWRDKDSGLLLTRYSNAYVCNARD